MDDSIKNKKKTSSSSEKIKQFKKNNSPYLRPANEDDDGYDPYSDRRIEPPLFERDPWD